MKRYIFVAVVVALVLSVFSSCRRASELPPLNKGYATTVIMPEPEDLTAADRAYVRELKEEYENAIK